MFWNSLDFQVRIAVILTNQAINRTFFMPAAGHCLSISSDICRTSDHLCVAINVFYCSSFLHHRFWWWSSRWWCWWEYQNSCRRSIQMHQRYLRSTRMLKFLFALAIVRASRLLLSLNYPACAFSQDMQSTLGMANQPMDLSSMMSSLLGGNTPAPAPPRQAITAKKPERRERKRSGWFLTTASQSYYVFTLFIRYLLYAVIFLGFFFAPKRRHFCSDLWIFFFFPFTIRVWRKIGSILDFFKYFPK